MDDKLIQSRIYIDTFSSDQYHHDMEENLGAMSPVQKANRTMESMPRKSIFRTKQQKDQSVDKVPSKLGFTGVEGTFVVK